ncbi:MAG: MFS transporter [Chloroflexi bacterium]|nr:MFS transporter [Chloroflexota bacterium]
MTATLTGTFVRDRYTWLAYFLLGYYAYSQAGLGPLMPFLRAELGLNYTLAGLHLSTFAAGMIIAGLTADRVAQRWGRPLVLWGGGSGMMVGALLLISGRHPSVTIAGTLLMGWLGTYLLIMIQATLADRHGLRRAIALTEANVMAALFATLAPLLIGIAAGTLLGWRAAVIAAVVAWVGLLLRFRGESVPAANAPIVAAGGNPAVRLPYTFWLYWVVILLSVAVEWCVIFWGADFLDTVVGLERTLASALMSVFLAAMFFGRLIGSRLAFRVASSRLLIVAVVIVVVGFPAFWLGTTPLINIAGLFIVGLGVANLFPLGLSAAASLAPDRSNAASARVSLAGGLAILLMPQLLGSTADQIGIGNAFAIAGVIIVLVLMLTLVANRVTS